jgi:CHAT domain-containing protein
MGTTVLVRLTLPGLLLAACFPGGCTGVQATACVLTQTCLLLDVAKTVSKLPEQVRAQREMNERLQRLDEERQRDIEIARMIRVGRFDEVERLDNAPRYSTQVALARDLDRTLDELTGVETLFFQPRWQSLPVRDTTWLSASPISLGRLTKMWMNNEEGRSARHLAREELQGARATADLKQELIIQMYLGEVEELDRDARSALVHLEAGLRLAEEIRSDSWRVFFLSRQAEVLLALHDYSAALAATQQARGLVEPGDLRAVVIMWNNLGVALHYNGDVSGALAAYQAGYERLSMAEDGSADPWPSRATLLSNLGLTQWQQGDLSGAMLSFRRALAAREVESSLRWTERTSFEQAETLAEELNPIVSLERQNASAGGTPLGLQVLLERKGLLLDQQARSLLAIRSSLAAPDAKPPTFNFSLRDIFDPYSRAARKSEQELQDLAHKEDAFLWEQYRLALSQRAELRDQWTSASNQVEEHARQVAGVETRIRTIQREIENRRASASVALIGTPSKSSADGSERGRQVVEEASTSVDPERAGLLEKVQERIPSGSALIEIFVFKPVEIRSGMVAEPQSAPPRYAAYLVRHSGAPIYVDLGEASSLDALIVEFRKALDSPHSLEAARELGRRLDQRVTAPMRQVAGDASAWLVAPERDLNLIPFGALVDEAGHYLAERLTFNYIGSGRDLLRQSGDDPPRAPPLIVADPSFDSVTAVSTAPSSSSVFRRSRDFPAVRFPSLPGTAAEAAAIKRFVPDANLLTGGNATETALKHARGPRFLHLATHGFFLEDQHRVREGRAWRELEDPMLRSGLVLAGANAGGSGADDGILTALETLGLDLAGTRLVVLSACQTGLGDVRTGEGVFGLRRAFVIAGAQTLVMSLWSVDDDITQLMMEDYYARLARGQDRIGALRQAQLSLLADPRVSHPYFWAGFIASGAAGPLN